MTKNLPDDNSSSDLPTLPAEGFVRASDFIGKGKLIPISRSSWFAMVRSGRAPKPKSLGPRTSVYDVASLRLFMASLPEVE